MTEKEQPLSTEVSSVLSMEQLEELFADLRTRSFGRPLNQDKPDLSELGLSGLATHTINNLGDPYNEDNHQIESKAYERQVINYMASLYGLHTDAWGYITSGRNEGNLFALYMARESLESKSRNNLNDGGIKPILFFSKATHHSIPKAARITGMQYRVIDTDDTGEINYLDLEHAINQYQYRPMLFVLNMGTKFTGATDSLQRVDDLLLKYNVTDYFIHCDAALSGMVIPFSDAPLSMSFEKGIDSIVISGDKFLGSPIPSAMVVTRKQFTEYIKNDIESFGISDVTISGTRYGMAAIAIWYILQEKQEKLPKEVKQCLDNTHFLQQLLTAQDYPCFVNEHSITLVFKKPLSQEFIERYQLTVEGNWAHIILMPHVTEQRLEKFVDELIDSEQQELKKRPALHAVK